MPNFGYHFARFQAAIVRFAYARCLAFLPPPLPDPPRTLPFEAYTYSGEAALPEQVASIRSFLRNAGRPRKLTIVSDGTYSARSLALLRRLDPCITISDVNEWLPLDVPPRLGSYLSGHPTGKQLALIQSLPANGPAFYFDSDVLFFPGASSLAEELAACTVPAAYLEDCQLSADERLLREDVERTRPVNTGVLYLREKLDWSASLQRILDIEGAPHFFSNQTVTHLAMHANGAEPLNPARFVLQLDDQFVYPDRYAGPDIILRHYVNPVRHKFWTTLCQ